MELKIQQWSSCHGVERYAWIQVALLRLSDVNSEDIQELLGTSRTSRTRPSGRIFRDLMNRAEMGIPRAVLAEYADSGRRR